MQSALLAGAFFMGLAGSPHCLAMCGAACGGMARVVRVVHRPAGAGAGAADGAPRLPDSGAGAPWAGRAAGSAALALHGGRIAGYAVAGALAAGATQALGLASVQVTALRPAWALLHAAIAAWGLLLLVAGRQPWWALRGGQALVARLRPLAASPLRLGLVGLLWAALPCGLLYSALLLAALTNHPAQGALFMALFALGSGMALWLGPWLWQRASRRIGARSRAWGTRLTGAALLALSAQALGLDLGSRLAAWCG